VSIDEREERRRERRIGAYANGAWWVLMFIRSDAMTTAAPTSSKQPIPPSRKSLP
jgi:hypothetical protein